MSDSSQDIICSVPGCDAVIEDPDDIYACDKCQVEKFLEVGAVKSDSEEFKGQEEEDVL